MESLQGDEKGKPVLGKAVVEIGRRARKLREEKGLTLEAVAKKAKLGMGALSEIENGKREGRLSSLRRLAKVLGIPWQQLLGD